MASSKLEIKSLNKTKPFYGLYTYRAIIHVPGAGFMRRAIDLNDYLYNVDSHNKSIRPGYYNYKMRVGHKADELSLIETLLPHIKKWKKSEDIAIRFETSSLRLFYNDPKMHRKLLKITDKWEFAEADVSPPGIKYFINTPPAQYRTYMSGERTTVEVKNELETYFRNRPNLKTNSTLKEWLSRSFNASWYNPYLSDSHYFDYDDPKELFTLKLLYPELIGKTYKLEKKPE